MCVCFNQNTIYYRQAAVLGVFFLLLNALIDEKTPKKSFPSSYEFFMKEESSEGERTRKRLIESWFIDLSYFPIIRNGCEINFFDSNFILRLSKLSTTISPTANNQLFIFMHWQLWLPFNIPTPSPSFWVTYSRSPIENLLE